jgi:hypothetical protein
MNKARHSSLALVAALAILVAAACRDAASPPGTITAGVNPPPPPPKGGGECANFRLTGGGRTDDRSHVTANKSTPESHDFATFGFEARPNGCPGTDGRGNLEWNEHDLNAYGGGFAFHGTVTFFTTPIDETAGTPGCGRFGGFGRMNPKSGGTTEQVPFQVFHACDVDEPGVGKDHISIAIGPIGSGGPTYQRHGLLSGGNIQWHKLTGNN